MEATTPAIEWKVGDTALFEFKTVTIKEIRPTGGVQVTDGFFSTYGDLREELFPVTFQGETVARFFREHYHNLHAMKGNHLFNWPDLFRAINYRFNRVMRNLDNPDRMTEYMAEADAFFEKIRTLTEQVNSLELDDFRLFGR